jgi:hypothetical protein
MQKIAVTEKMMINIEDTQEYKDWLEKLNKLDDYINSLKVWNDYAERMQSRYDDLLSQDPRKNK